MAKRNQNDIDTAIRILEEEERECVSPKLEEARRTDKSIVIVQGGRGAGAKSWSIASLIIQACQNKKHRVACLREVQLSLNESVYQLMIDTIKRLRYTDDWDITEKRITQKKTGAYIIFRGLHDLRAATQAKGLEGIDIVWCEEASTIVNDSWLMLMPTLVRNNGWKLYISYNPEKESDPCTERFWTADRNDVLRIRVEPGKADNPWWNDGLQNEMDIAYRLNPEEAEYVWGGKPRRRSSVDVFHNVTVHDFDVDEKHYQNLRYGIDFGFNHANAYISVGFKDGELYIMREIYQKGKINSDFIGSAALCQWIVKERIHTADSADPDKIAEWCRAGYRVGGARKGPDSLWKGIEYLKSLPRIHIHKTNCPNTAREFYAFKYHQSKDGIIADKEYVEINDDTIAATRYAVEEFIGLSDTGFTGIVKGFYS
jgi:phage terminase large subunit